MDHFEWEAWKAESSSSLGNRVPNKEMRLAFYVTLSDFRRILLVQTADEFYCAMGQLSAEMMDFTKEDSDKLIKVRIIIN